MTADSPVDPEGDLSEDASGSAPEVPRPPRPRGSRIARIPLPDFGVTGPSSAAAASSGVASVVTSASDQYTSGERPEETEFDSSSNGSFEESAGPVPISELEPSVPVFQDSPEPARFENVPPSPCRANGARSTAAFAGTDEASPAVVLDDDGEHDDTVVGSVPEGLIAMSLAPPAPGALGNDAETSAFTAPKELLELAKRKREERMAERAAQGGSRDTLPTEVGAGSEGLSAVDAEEQPVRDVGLSEPTRAVVASDFAAQSFAAAELEELRARGVYLVSPSSEGAESVDAERTQLSAVELESSASLAPAEKAEPEARVAVDTINTEEAPPVPAHEDTGVSRSLAEPSTTGTGPARAALWVAVACVFLLLGYAMAKLLP